MRAFFFLLILTPIYSNAFSLDASSFVNIDQLVPEASRNTFIKTIGLGTAHRSYEPATALMGGVGLEFGVELTIAQIPQSFRDVLSQAGSNSSNLRILPIPRGIVHKRLLEKFDVGGSFVGYQGLVVIGADFKYTFHQPEEGPTFAFRGNYTYSKLGIYKGHTIEPQIVVSRRLNFADPFISVGYAYSIGTLSLDIPTGVPGISVSQDLTGKGGAFKSQLGVVLHFWPTGIRLTLHGEYVTFGTNSLGIKFGFEF
ncbi:MAG: hypothetical protein CL678_08405 [Bdellovibrionaceae bacterium]|nr:hypothetical protein [Pseudobdellovibrionaceae bacterium]|tara:strand:+ start:720 stop:1484 length:765 start_codon:yes stop_codon:yes gene_type:complete